LNNVERRLACQYGTAASLSIRSDPNAGTIVEIRLPIERTAPVEPVLQGVAR
jgi:sensor histidine kinase YesM